MRLLGFTVAGSLLTLSLGACGSDDPVTPGDSDAQTPPTTGRVAVEAWLADATYNDWACEAAIHASRDPSPHGFNRICSNDVLAANVSGTADWPKGSAGVKELYASASATTPIGFAVYLKTDADSAGGDNWYWYERINSDTIADGMGDSGPAKTICVGCHIGAGIDLAHTPTPGGRDQVYTPVQ